MDCKHQVGYIDECYDGTTFVELGDALYCFEDVVFYKFCPLCGEELKGDLVVIKEHKATGGKYGPLMSTEEITRQALKILGETINKDGIIPKLLNTAD